MDLATSLIIFWFWELGSCIIPLDEIVPIALWHPNPLVFSEHSHILLGCIIHQYCGGNAVSFS